MSWSRRAILALPLALAACGFVPVYGTGGSGSALQNAVRVQEQADRDGFLLVQRLEERLGRAAAPRFELGLTLTTVEGGLAVDPEGSAERFNVIGNATYSLRDLETGAVVTSGAVDDFTGYSASGSTVATLAAQEDARSRLMTILADEIVVRLQSADLGA